MPPQLPEREAQCTNSSAIRHRLHINDNAARFELAEQLGKWHFQAMPMGNRQHNCIGGRKVLPFAERFAVVFMSVSGLGVGIVNYDVLSELSQARDDVDDFGISEVSTILFERHAQYIYIAAGQLALCGDDRFDRLLGDVATHAVIDTPPSGLEITGFTRIPKVFGYGEICR